MTFYHLMQEWQDVNWKDYLRNVSSQKIINIIKKDKLEPTDFLTLLSPRASNHLEMMARKAHKLTVQNFGRVIFLYAPLYLSNYCANKCAYCSFNHENNFQRQKLNLTEVRKEAELVASKGIKHILIVTGSSRKH